MERLEILQSDNLVKLLHHLRKGLWRPDIIPGSEGVARIDTDAHPRLVLHAVNNVPQLLEPRADNVPRASHVLQHGDGVLRLGVGPVQHLGYPAARLLHVRAAAVARVEVVQPDAQLVTPSEVIYEVGVGLLGLDVVRLREVDEVAAVGEGVPRRVVGVLDGEGAVLRADVGRERGVRPFALGLEEEGEGVGADVRCVLQRVVNAWGNGVSMDGVL